MIEAKIPSEILNPTNSRHYLHVVPRYFPYIGGSEKYMQEVAERMAAKPGASVSVFTTDAWDLEHFWSAGKRTVTRGHEVLNRVAVRRFGVRRLPLVSPLFYPVMRRVLTSLSAAPIPDRLALPLLNLSCRTTPLVPSLEQALKQTRFDLVHACNAPFDSLIYASFTSARQQGAAFVITPFIHLGEPENPQIRKYYTMRHQLEWMKQADAVFTMTSLERDYLVAQNVLETKVHVVGVGIEPSEIVGGDGTQFRAKHKIEGPLVFFQGTAAYDKGTHHIVQAMQRLWQSGYEATLVIAGPIMSHFQRFYDELPSSDKARIRLLGFISPQEKRDLFAAGDLFLMPSRTDSFGIVYLEAWLCGIPVIGARAGGVPAVIAEEQDGLLINFGDVGDLADKIKLLLADRTTATRLAEAGRQKVLARYTWEKVFGQIHEVYRALLRS
ncbi:MAG: glycosyltransferase family 4 protein [Chloroflexi bacterium]|nr:glycosyltransferase family 4 protein [Chloroflexota bacterium]